MKKVLLFKTLLVLFVFNSFAVFAAETEDPDPNPGSFIKYNINNQEASQGGYIEVCGVGDILMNAGASKIGNKYAIAVEECNSSWVKTGTNSFLKWFTGTVSNGINLKQYCQTYGGFNMTGGKLPSGQDRYYVVTLAYNGASWHSLKVLVRLVDANPEMNMNGVTQNGVTYCASSIRLNGYNTSCESKYMIGIHESDINWNRTHQYEVNVWFQGKAPNNININNIAATYSNIPAHFSGHASRRGQPMLGGNLPSGLKRYYRVSICTNESVWKCKTMLVAVNGNCKSAGVEDTNTYVVWNDESVSSKVLTKTSNQPGLSIFPNPFNDQTTIRLEKLSGEPVTLNVYDLNGRKVRTVLDQQSITGTYQVDIQKGKLSKGMYFLVGTIGDKKISKKLVVE